MALFLDSSLSVAALFVLTGAATAAQSASLLDRAQQTVAAYVGMLADVHCTEEVEQVKLRPNGKPEASLKTQYDYFLLMQGTDDDFQLAESRLEIGKAPAKQAPFLLTNGFSTLLIIFHPYYRGSFEFTPEAPESVAGRVTMRYRFAHVAGTRTPAALALRGREYPLDLQGTAWLDEETGQALRIDAQLLHPMTDIGLRSLTIHVEYGPAAGIADRPVLPSLAEVNLETPRQHWRNTHVFHDYKLFSADATQDPNVKVHVNAPGPQPTSPESAKPDTSKPNNVEKP